MFLSFENNQNESDFQASISARELVERIKSHFMVYSANSYCSGQSPAYVLNEIHPVIVQVTKLNSW